MWEGCGCLVCKCVYVNVCIPKKKIPGPALRGSDYNYFGRIVLIHFFHQLSILGCVYCGLSDVHMKINFYRLLVGEQHMYVLIFDHSLFTMVKILPLFFYSHIMQHAKKLFDQFRRKLYCDTVSSDIQFYLCDTIRTKLLS